MIQTAWLLLNRHKWLGSILLFIPLMGASTFAALHPLIPNILINILFPMTIILIAYKRTEIFVLLKAGTLIFSRSLIVLVVLGYINTHFFVYLFIYLFAFNMLEAAGDDLINKRWISFFGSLSIIVGIFFMNGIWADNAYVYLTVPPPHFVGIIIAYILWHSNFIFLKFGQAIGMYHFIIQAVPVVAMLVMLDSGYYLALRGNALLLGGMLQIYSPERVQSYFANEKLIQTFSFLGERLFQIAIAVACYILVLLSFL